MARTKEFDPDAALQDALELFWERGYAATSMEDLVERLGVARASLYATFGTKHELYFKALDRYRESHGPVERLSQPGPALPAVRELVRDFAAEAAGDRRRRGCFVLNTAIELVPADETAARRVAAAWGEMETALESALRRARAQGELSADADPRSLARFLLVLLQGLKAVGKGAPDAERLREAAEQALRLLA